MRDKKRNQRERLTAGELERKQRGGFGEKESWRGLEQAAKERKQEEEDLK